MVHHVHELGAIHFVADGQAISAAFSHIYGRVLPLHIDSARVAALVRLYHSS